MGSLVGSLIGSTTGSLIVGDLASFALELVKNFTEGVSDITGGLSTLIEMGVDFAQGYVDGLAAA